MPIRHISSKGDRARPANWKTLQGPKARLSVLITVLLALAAALFPLADGHVAQAQSTRVQMVYSWIEVDPLEFEEDVGTVRVGILAETNETGAPTGRYGVTLGTNSDTAHSFHDCVGLKDYRPKSEVLQFPLADFEAFTNDDGETRYRQTLYSDVWIYDDRVLEEAESFQLNLKIFHIDDPYPLFDVDELELTIIDNDGFVGVAFDSTAITVTEGTASTYRLALGSLPSGNVTVAIVDPPNAEVTAEPGAVTFTPTDWYVPQTVTVAADHDADATDETIMTIAHLVSSVDDSSFEGLIADSVTVTVRDDDGGGTNTSKTSLDHDTAAVRGANRQGLVSEMATEPVKVDFALVAPEPVREDAGTVRIEVVAATYSPGEPVDTSIDVHPKNITAEQGGDYRFLDSYGDDSYYRSVEFLRGDFEPFVDIEGDTRYRAVKYFDVIIINDSLAEDAESFELTFEDDYGHFFLGDRECASIWYTSVTIIDDDPPVQMEYSLVEAGPFDEDAGTVQVEVVAVTNEAGVPNTEYAVRARSQNDTARSPGDYEEVDETLVFPLDDFEEFVDELGNTRYRQSMHFDVVIRDNSYDEDAETFLLQLSEISGYQESVFGVPEIEVTINDNDTAGVTVQPTELTIEEGATKTYSVVLDSTPTWRNATVTINDPANPEITAEPDSLTFTSNNWDEPQIVTVTADHDSDASDEAATEITHTVTSAFSQYDGLDADDVTVTVTDDDPQMEYSLVDAGPFDEDAGTVQVGVVAVTNEDGVPSIDYAVAVQSEDVTATSGGDYEAVDETLVFAVADFAVFTDGAGETRYRQSVYFDVVIVDNFYDEDAETFLLKLSESPGYEGSVFGVPQTEVTINDDDTAAVSISKPSLEIEEGDSDTYDVELDTEPAGDVTVTIGGTTDTDLSLDKDTLTFTDQNWNVPQTVTVTADHDSDAADEAEVTLTHTASSDDDAYDGLKAADLTVTITDDDPAVTVSFEYSSYTVSEGSGVTVKVKLNADPERTVDITLISGEPG